MSNQIDNKVVSMEFDNSRFEKNVHTSMSTLDKLKQKLNLSGAAKGLEEVDKASRKVDMSTMSKGVETVHAKFSALEIMGITALTNITNKAVDAGMRIAKALTIDPVTTGLQEYETKMNAIQVIKSNTRAHYTNEAGQLDEVAQMAAIEKALSDLNDYADKTIYNYTQMTSNVGKFVAQGLGIDEATKAVQGLANLAGASGATAEDMARATYQMSQALGGTIRKIDWNSLRNANMATVELKNTLMEFARVEGIDIDAMIKEKGTFEDTLEKGWLSGELFTKAMNVYSDAYSEAELKAMGFKDDQIANFKSLAKEAQSATTEVKSMSQLWDVLKETAQSGWTQTWELIFGGFNEAKKMFTELQVYFSGIINAFSNARNFVLGIALNFKNVWQSITDKLDKAGLGKITEAIDNVKGGLKKLAYWQDIVNKVWRGDYNNHGDNPDRFDLLKKAGYDHRVVQDLVNKGYKYKLTMEDVEASHKKFGLTMEQSTETTKKTTKAVTELTDEQLKNAGLTDDEISLYRALQKEADNLGMSFDDLVGRMSEVDGRSLLIDSFKNLWDGIAGIFKAIKKAYVEIFNPPGLGELGVKLYSLILRFNMFTEKLRLTDKESGKLNDNGKKLVRTFKGIFALVDIVTTIIGGPLKIAFKIITKILGAFGFNILDVTAIIGDALVALRDWIDSILDFGAIFEWMLPYLKIAKDAVVDWYNATKPFAKIADIFKSAFDGIKEWFEGLKDVDNIPKYIIEGLVNGFKAGLKAVGSAIAMVANYIVEVFCKIFGIQSPSVLFFTLGGFIIAGLLLGIKAFAPEVWKTLEDVFGNVIDFVKKIDFGGVITAIIGLGLVKGLNTMANALEGVVDVFGGLGDIMEGLGKGLKKTLKGFGSFLKGKAWEARGKGIMYFAIGVGVLAASVYALAQLDAGKLWATIGAIAVLAGIMIGLTFLVSKMSEMGGLDISKQGVQIKKVTTQLIPIAAALLLVGIAVKQLAGLGVGDLIKGGLAVVVLGGVLIGIAALGKLIGPVDKLGGNLVKIALAIGLLALVAKMIGGMDPESLFKGILFMGVFVVFIALLTLITKLGGNSIDKLGGTLMKMALAIGILALVARMIGGMDPAKLALGTYFIDEFVFIVLKLTLLAMLAGDRTLGKLGSMMLGISIAMIMMALVVRIVGGMDPASLAKGIIVINIFTLMIIKLISAVALLGGGQAGKIGLTILAFSVSMGILAAVVSLLGLMKISSLAKGIVAMSLLGVIMQGLIKSTKDARNCHKNIMMMAIVIGVMALAIGLLSIIDPKNLASATAAIAAVTGVFALLLKSMSGLKSIKGAQKEIFKTLIMLTAIIGVFALIIWGLSYIPAENVLDKALGLSALMVALSVALIAVSYAGKFASTAKSGIIALSAMVIPLALFTAALAFMPQIPGHVASQLPMLGIVIGAMTLLLFPLSLVGKIGIGAVMTGILALTSMIVPLCALVAALTFMPEFPTWVGDQLKLLLPALTWLTLLMPILTLCGLGGPAAIIGIGSLAALIVAIGGLATLCGALGDGFKNLLEKGLPMLVMIAGGIGEMIGAFVGGIAVGICNSLVRIGEALSKFMENATPFFDGLKAITPEMTSAAKSLAGLVLALTTADLLQGITSLLGLDGGMDTVGKKLAGFGKSIKEFLVSVEDLTEDDLKKADLAAQVGVKMADMADKMPKSGGILQDLVGESDLVKFSESIVAYGEAIVAFGNSVSTVTPEQTKSIKSATEAGAALSDLANSVPKNGGIWQDIAGAQDLSAFGEKIIAFGNSIVQYASTVSTITKDDANIIKRSAEAGEALSDLNGVIPTDGGWWQAIAGSKDIGSFGEKIVKFAEGLLDYVVVARQIDPDNDTVAIENTKKVIEKLKEVAELVPESGGWWAGIAGSKDAGGFGDAILSLANGIIRYLEAASKITKDSIDKISNSKDAIEALEEVASAVPEDHSGVNNIKSFMDKMNSVMDYVKTYIGKASLITKENITAINTSKSAVTAVKNVASAFKDVDSASVNTASTTLKTMADVLSSMTLKNFTGVDKFTKALTDISSVDTNKFKTTMSSLGDSGLDSFVKTLTDGASKAADAGKALIKGVVDGISSGLPSVATTMNAVMSYLRMQLVTFNVLGKLITQSIQKGMQSQSGALHKTATSMVSLCASKLLTYYLSFYIAGAYVASGFANGITANKYLASNAGSALGKAALEAAKKALDENSPSKEMYKVGNFAGVGFIRALYDNVSQAFKAGTIFANSAKVGITNAVSKISDIVNNDIDAQPTIRPVLDLSDVSAGAGTINKMLSMNPSVGVLARTGSISTMMNERQNGNGEVVSALKDLKKTIGNKSGDTYTFGNVTYGDDSAVSDAVGALVRAIRVEGRA